MHALEFAWISTAHPIRPRFIILYSNVHNVAAYADTVVVVLDYHSILRVGSAWGRRLSHWFIDESVATPVIMLKKHCIKAFMVTSTTLR